MKTRRKRVESICFCPNQRRNIGNILNWHDLREHFSAQFSRLNCHLAHSCHKLRSFADYCSEAFQATIGGFFFKARGFQFGPVMTVCVSMHRGTTKASGQIPPGVCRRVIIWSPCPIHDGMKPDPTGLQSAWRYQLPSLTGQKGQSGVFARGEKRGTVYYSPSRFHISTLMKKLQQSTFS